MPVSLVIGQEKGLFLMSLVEIVVHQIDPALALVQKPSTTPRTQAVNVVVADLSNRETAKSEISETGTAKDRLHLPSQLALRHELLIVQPATTVLEAGGTRQLGERVGLLMDQGLHDASFQSVPLLIEHQLHQS